ncbi:hypothetical protein NQ038_13180 [Brevibacterium sp. 50QC2O2]|uniref:hypothetical protein n=1 Tax=Brevibacterium TaxID=1696 RepID=UPI00211BE560|nr:MULTISPECIES: hypothetical protein [unclassified Brevibacterium]MCQ9366668.1 hypothetical protein [Brevibacterium sp. 91QC2O2]MCQ9384355.1 hypothetical protein [Brevibacterium sp. 68QC2CO]MCQ9389592.1 hypothetical protein [Brevibacterium sp. 50QC2O2]
MAEENGLPGDVKYWFNVRTGQVEEGPLSGWENRMGPYDTREEAQAALRTAATRNRDWDDEDKDWDGK